MDIIIFLKDNTDNMLSTVDDINLPTAFHFDRVTDARDFVRNRLGTIGYWWDWDNDSQRMISTVDHFYAVANGWDVTRELEDLV